MAPFVYQRGETISLALDALSGDPASVSGVTAQMKAVPPGRSSVPADTPIAATFAIVSRAAAGDIPPGWTLTIDAATSAALLAGAYLADARIVSAGGVIITEQVAIRIRDAVTS
jgi:hypothetical protein